MGKPIAKAPNPAEKEFAEALANVIRTHSTKVSPASLAGILVVNAGEVIALAGYIPPEQDLASFMAANLSLGIAIGKEGRLLQNPVGEA